MVSLTSAAVEQDGVALVTARLEGDATARRVRLRNRLDGPVWPPRVDGVPAPGWDDRGVELVVPAGSTVALGYACPAPPADAPVELVDAAVVDGDAATVTDPAAAAVRDLGDPSPPRDAVPVPTGSHGTANATTEDPTQGDDSGDPAGTGSGRCRPAVGAASGEAGAPSQADGPGEVAAWLDAVEGRVATAEALAAAESLPAATDALRDAGGLDRARRLVEDLEDDVRDLETFADRAGRLADRANAADVPLDALERIA